MGSPREPPCRPVFPAHLTNPRSVRARGHGGLTEGGGGLGRTPCRLSPTTCATSSPTGRSRATNWPSSRRENPSPRPISKPWPKSSASPRPPFSGAERGRLGPVPHLHAERRAPLRRAPDPRVGGGGRPGRPPDRDRARVRGGGDRDDARVDRRER